MGETAWAKKAQNLHRDERAWERWGEAASKPTTPGSLLQHIVHTVTANRNRSSRIGGVDVLKAVAAHPNTPPHLLVEILSMCPAAAHSFCTNPVTPLLLLEQPGFVADLEEKSQYFLLREAAAPPLFVKLLATGNAAKSEAVRTAARLHIAFAGEATSRNEWEEPLRDYWRAECADSKGWLSTITKTRQWHADLVEMGFAPTWAMGLVPFPEPTPAAEFPLIKEWLRFEHSVGSPKETALLQLIAPKVKNTASLAWRLRADATPTDLHDLLRLDVGKGTHFCAAILYHPSVTAEIIAEMAEIDGEHRQQIIVRHPKTPTHVVARLLESGHPHLRRLARCHPNAPANAMEISRRIVHRMGSHVEMRFVSFVSCLHGPHKRNNLPQKAEHHDWTERLEAVFLADPTDEPLSGDSEERTGCDLLNHLSHDGNRIVRAAAKTRLADPNYQFVL